MSERTRTVSTWAGRLATLLSRLVYFVARHWLLMVNVVLALQATLPALPPILMVTAHISAARLLYTAFRPLCHQLPERSFFLFGPQLSYTLGELQKLVGPDVPLRYIGDRAVGYKMAVCQRDMATYMSMFLAGLAFVLLRRRLKPLPLKAFALFAIPMAVDGFGQLFGLWESTWWSRVVSGSLFGVACVWLAFPYVESGMADVRRTLTSDQS
jgi:uncharacterized membrane protein